MHDQHFHVEALHSNLRFHFHCRPRFLLHTTYCLIHWRGMDDILQGNQIILRSLFLLSFDVVPLYEFHCLVSYL